MSVALLAKRISATGSGTARECGSTFSFNSGTALWCGRFEICGQRNDYKFQVLTRLLAGGRPLICHNEINCFSILLSQFQMDANYSVAIG